MNESRDVQRTGGRERGTRGFSLIEVIIAIGVLAGLLLSIATMFILGGRQVKNGKTITQATALAQDMMEEFDRASFTGLYTANTQADVKVYEDIYQSFGKSQFDQAVKTLVNVARYGFELPPSPGGQQFVQAYIDAINRVLTGDQSPKQALDQAQREAQKAIDDNRR